MTSPGPTVPAPKVRGGPRSLKVNLVWAATGQLVYVVAQFGVLAALTRLATPVDVGRFGLASAIATPIIMLANLGMRTGVATDVGSQYRFVDYARLRIITSFLAICAIVAVGWLFAPDTETVQIVFLVALMKSSEAQSDLFYGFFQRGDRMDLVARSLMLRGPLSTVFFVATLWYTRSPFYAFFSQVVIWTLVGQLHDRPVAWRHSDQERHPLQMARLLRLAREMSALGLAASMTHLAASAPRLIVGWTMGLKALGYFTTVGYVLQVGMMAIQSAALTLASPLARAHAGGQVKRFRRLLIRTSGLFFLATSAGSALAYIWGSELLHLMFGPEYRDYDELLTILLLTLSVRSIGLIHQTGIVAQRKFRTYGALRLMMLIGVVGFCLLGVWLDGLHGIGWSLLITAVLHTGVSVWLAHRPPRPSVD